MSRTTHIDGDRHEGGRYEIRLKGHLDPRWATWFDGMSLTHDTDGTTAIHGQVADQAALHGLLQKVRDVGLPLVSIGRMDLENTDEPANEPLSALPTSRQGDRR